MRRPRSELAPFKADREDLAPSSLNARPRIVHVIPTLRLGGLESVVVQLTERLLSVFEQTVVSPSHDGPLRARFSEDVRVVAMAERHGPDYWNAVRMARLFRTLRPQIVHSRNWSCVDAIVGARLAGVPVVIHGEHGREAADPNGRNVLRRRVRRLLGPLVTQFVTVSQDLAHWLIEDVGIPAVKVTPICNGVDIGRFGGGNRDAARRELGIRPGTFAIGTVARLDPVKDQAGLVAAFARIVEDPRVLLVIAGDGPCRAEIARAVADLGLEERVRLLGERADVPSVLSAFDVFVLPSLGEGISNTILEAMSTGLPVVATRVGGNPELVVKGSTGLLVPPGDRAALAGALKSYLDNPALAMEHGQAGQARARAHFSIDRMVAAYHGLYARFLT